MCCLCISCLIVKARVEILLLKMALARRTPFSVPTNNRAATSPSLYFLYINKTWGAPITRYLFFYILISHNSINLILLFAKFLTSSFHWFIRITEKNKNNNTNNETVIFNMILIKLLGYLALKNSKISCIFNLFTYNDSCCCFCFYSLENASYTC